MITAMTSKTASISTAGTDEPLDAMVRVRGLTKSFVERKSWAQLVRRPFARSARVTVVDGVSFDVRPAEFFGLLGANGAGKTTLFRMLAAQLLPDSGSATIAGCDVVQDPRAVRRLLTPVVADERSLNWRLTARENLELFAALYAVEPGEVAQRVDELLATVELDSAGTKMVGTFSSGMKQRLLIARALLPRPKVLLLDEPTRSLDPISARRFRQFLREEIAGRQGCTVLLATHSAEEAFELCNRVAVLDRGRVLAVGRVEELMDQVRDDRYRVTVRESQTESAMRLAGRHAGADPVLLGPRDAPGWTVLEVSISGGADGAADMVASLTRAGIDVAGMEYRSLTLADLLERIVAARKEHHA